MWTIDSCPGLYPVWPTSHSHVTPTLKRKQSLSLYEVPTHTNVDGYRLPSSLPALMTQKNCFLLFFFFNSLLFFRFFSLLLCFFTSYIFSFFFFFCRVVLRSAEGVGDRPAQFSFRLHDTIPNKRIISGFPKEKKKRKKNWPFFSLFRLRLNRAKTKNSKSVNFFF